MKDSWSVLTELLKVAVRVFFISLIIASVLGTIILSWGEEEALERCMQEHPERTYEECESAVVW